MINYTVEKVRQGEPLPYDYAVRYRDIYGSVSYLQVNGMVCTFSKDDAESITEIMNNQVKAATEYALKEISNGKEL